MDSLQETLRQIRIALFLMFLILSVGVFGFVMIEGMSPIQALWLTVITLATVGYGDVFARTDAGRLFTIFLLGFGLSVVTFGIQAGANFFINPAIRDVRRRQTHDRRIAQLENHYIICGHGELVDKTIAYLIQRSEARRTAVRDQHCAPLDHLLNRLLRTSDQHRHRWLREPLRRLLLGWYDLLHPDETLLTIVVVITEDGIYAQHLREKNLTVIEGESTDEAVLRRAGIQRAQALMAMLDRDTETLLTVLTAHGINPNLYITAAALDEALSQKMLRVGANNVITPYEIAGQALNSSTLRPAVYAFFNSILFDYQTDSQATQIPLFDESPWIGRTLHRLRLHETHQAGVIGLLLEDGSYLYAPSEDYVLKENEVLIVVAPAAQIPALQQAARGTMPGRVHAATFQRLPPPPPPQRTSSSTHALREAGELITTMRQHYVICGSSQIGRSVVAKLNPERPFVVISDDNAFTSDLIKRGFLVVHGSPADEQVLRRAGAERALSVMVNAADAAVAVMTVLNVRAFSKRILITASAENDEMALKLTRAGADRVVNPFSIAAQWVLLSTTRPVVSDYLQYVLYNHRARLETTELYMESSSPWIGSRLSDLRLARLFRAGVIGIRHDSERFTYAPSDDYIIAEQDVLIVVTPMEYADELRDTAHGSDTKRPTTLRAGPPLR